MKNKLPFALIFCSFFGSVLIFGFNKTTATDNASYQEDGFLGLYVSADQKWGLTPAVFGTMQTQLQNKINVYAFYSDGSINKNLSLFTPELDDPAISQIESPDNWGSWENGKTSKEGTGNVVFTWNNSPKKKRHGSSISLAKS